VAEDIAKNTTWISPSYQAGKLGAGSIEDCIDVFEDRWRGWYFAPARSLLSTPNGTLTALLLVLPYFETYTIHLRGKDSQGCSEAFFTEGFLDVFRFGASWKRLGVGSMPPRFRANVAKRFYKAVRCGLFHSGMTKQEIAITDAHNAALTVLTSKAGRVSTLIIGPTRFIAQTEAHLAAYATRLRDPKQARLRGCFMKAWQLLHGGAVTIVLPPLPLQVSPPPLLTIPILPAAVMSPTPRPPI
jgi:hypothetical protein